MFVSTNAIFLQDDYIINHKPQRMIDLRGTRGGPLDPPVVENNVRQGNATSLPISAPIPCRSGRIVSQPDRYMFLGEAFQAVSIEFESDPTIYEEAMADGDSAH